MVITDEAVTEIVILRIGDGSVNSPRAEHNGEIVAIKPESGDYFLGEDEIEAADAHRWLLQCERSLIS